LSRLLGKPTAELGQNLALNSHGDGNGVGQRTVRSPPGLSRNIAVSALQHHRGLTPAAPGAPAFVHRKSRNYADGRTRAKMSGGV